MLKKISTIIILYILMQSSAIADVSSIHRLDDSIMGGWEVSISKDELTDEITSVAFRNATPSYEFMLLFEMCAVGEGNSDIIRNFGIFMFDLNDKMNGVEQMDAEVFIRMDEGKISHYKGLVKGLSDPIVYLTKYSGDGEEIEDQEAVTQKIFKEFSAGVNARIRIIVHHPSGTKEYNGPLLMGATKKALDLANCDLIYE